MMTATPNDAWLRHIWGQTSHHCGTQWSNIIFAKQMHHIVAKDLILIHYLSKPKENPVNTFYRLSFLCKPRERREAL